MIKGITLLFSMILIVSSCKITAQTDERKNLINKFISAVENYDTMQLYAIVDTSAYFEIQDKEDFLSQIKFIKERFKECSSTILDSTIKIYHRDIPFTDYTYSFCRDKSGKITDDSFDVQFTFADFEDNGKIHYFDVKRYKRNVTPTISSLGK
jgi:hypothetical protein